MGVSQAMMMRDGKGRVAEGGKCVRWAGKVAIFWRSCCPHKSSAKDQTPLTHANDDQPLSFQSGASPLARRASPRDDTGDP